MSQPDWSVWRHRHRPRHQDGQLGEGDRPVRQGPHRQHHRQEPQAVFYRYKWVFLRYFENENMVMIIIKYSGDIFKY